MIYPRPTLSSYCCPLLPPHSSGGGVEMPRARIVSARRGFILFDADAAQAGRPAT
jgi:hypothetical protein